MVLACKATYPVMEEQRKIERYTGDELKRADRLIDGKVYCITKLASIAAAKTVKPTLYIVHSPLSRRITDMKEMIEC